MRVRCRLVRPKAHSFCGSSRPRPVSSVALRLTLVCRYFASRTISSSRDSFLALLTENARPRAGVCAGSRGLTLLEQRASRLHSSTPWHCARRIVASTC